MAKLIAIEHPDLEADPTRPAKVTEKAFALIWEPKGWLKVEGSEEDPPVLVLPDGSLDVQIAKAQKALDEGRLTPTPDGETPVLVASTKPAEEQAAGVVTPVEAAAVAPEAETSAAPKKAAAKSTTTGTGA